MEILQTLAHGFVARYGAIPAVGEYIVVIVVVAFFSIKVLVDGERTWETPALLSLGGAAAGAVIIFFVGLGPAEGDCRSMWRDDVDEGQIKEGFISPRSSFQKHGCQYIVKDCSVNFGKSSC